MTRNSYIVIILLWILCIGLFIGSSINTNALVLQKTMIAAKQKQANIRKTPTPVKLLPTPEQISPSPSSSPSATAPLSGATVIPILTPTTILSPKALYTPSPTTTTTITPATNKIQ